jgi:hypothetical protein
MLIDLQQLISDLSVTPCNALFANGRPCICAPVLVKQVDSSSPAPLHLSMVLPP